VYSSAAYVVYSEVPVSTSYYQEPAPAAPPRYAQPQAVTTNIYQDGHDWGQDLRRDVVTWDAFVAFLRKHVLKLDNAQQDEFRRGFVLGYDNRGEEAFQKAMQEARGSTTPPPKPAL
jgi:hypothetical protein